VNLVEWVISMYCYWVSLN